VIGSYYGRLMTDAERGGRIRLDLEPLDAPVHTAWDLGIGDATAIWWWQMAGAELRIVDYYESHGVGLEHYAALVRGKPYQRGDDFVPQDARVREFVSGRTRLESMIALGLKPRVVKAHKVEDGINAVRRTLPRCMFHGPRCERGLDALRLYQSEWDDETRVLANRPKHDWTSHAADAFRYLALAWEEAATTEAPSNPLAELLRPRSLDEIWADYAAEHADEFEDDE
jgi:phage terminase large subunit